MKNASILLLFLLFSLSGYSQISHHQRVEIELNDDYSNEKIYEFGNKGIVMRSVKKIKAEDQEEWKYDFYDTDLKLAHTESVFLHKKFQAEQTFYDKDHTYTLYRDQKGNFSLVTVSPENHKILQADGVLKKKSYIRVMTASGDYCYFAGKTGGKIFLFSINWKTGEQKQIPTDIKGIRSSKVSLNDLNVLDETKEVMLCIRVNVGNKKNELYAMLFDQNGNSKGTHNLSINIEENLINASASNVGNGKYIFTGTFSSRSRSSSEGIYFAIVTGNKRAYISFQKFTDLDNFFSYLPSSYQAKIERKKKRKEAKGKEFNLSYNIATHDIITRDDGYLLIGEAYYPTYHTEYRTVTSTVNGVTTSRQQGYSVFDGYEYSHALIAKFGLKGELLWDQTFSMMGTRKSYSVDYLISITEQDEEIIKLVFPNRSYIESKIIGNEGSVLKTKSSDRMDTKVDGDEARWTVSYMKFWFDNFFIVHGEQKIKNTKDSNVKRKRKVYFLSKIEF